MNAARTRELLPAMTAFANGLPTEFRPRPLMNTKGPDDGWQILHASHEVSWLDEYEYRPVNLLLPATVKPIPKQRSAWFMYGDFTFTRIDMGNKEAAYSQIQTCLRKDLNGSLFVRDEVSGVTLDRLTKHFHLYSVNELLFEETLNSEVGHWLSSYYMKFPLPKGEVNAT
jgi:hypothetical protein